jgi:major membrane immunogen (membrane-anchored lipoprotein)
MIHKRRLIFCGLSGRPESLPRRVFALRLLPVFFIFFLLSCSDGKDSIKDGYYTAEAAEFDAYGWKEYVTIGVSSGRVKTIEYNAFNPSGFIKSWDMDYMRLMNANDGIYPNAYARAYMGQFLASQGTGGVDCIAGATVSYRTFIRLADAALENAGQGNSATRLVHIADPDENREGREAAFGKLP